MNFEMKKATLARLAAITFAIALRANAASDPFGHALIPDLVADLSVVDFDAGHAYKLECSLDGKIWQLYGGHENIIVQSPHIDIKAARVRYLRLSILKGAPGIWEFRVY